MTKLARDAERSSAQLRVTYGTSLRGLGAVEDAGAQEVLDALSEEMDSER